MPGSDTALAVDRTYSDPERHRRRKMRVRKRVVGVILGRRGGWWGWVPSSEGRLETCSVFSLKRCLRLPGCRFKGKFGLLCVVLLFFFFFNLCFFHIPTLNTLWNTK